MTNGEKFGALTGEIANAILQQLVDVVEIENVDDFIRDFNDALANGSTLDDLRDWGDIVNQAVQEMLEI